MEVGHGARVARSKSGWCSDAVMSASDTIKRVSLLLMIALTTSSCSDAAIESLGPPPSAQDPATPVVPGTPVVPDTTTTPLRGPFASVVSCTPPSAPADATLSIRPNVIYSSAGGEQQRLDIVGPATGAGRPMVLLIHGGGWRHGLRNDDSLRFTARVLAGQGYIAATADYRLTFAGVKNQFPAGVADVRCAVRWLRRNAATYGGDPNRIAVAGLSAGGHLAAMLGTARDESRLDDGSCGIPSSVSPGVQAAIAFYPPIELVSCAATALVCRLAATSFLGVDPALNPSLARFASPITYVDASDPPHLLVHGSRDSAVLPDQSRMMRDLLLARGVATGYVEVPGADHGFPILGASPSVLGSAAQLTESCTTLSFLRAALGS